jgi:VWFA-related protein
MGNRLTILALLAAVSLPLLAANQITIEQLQRTLTEAHAAHLSDNDTVRKLAGVELATRLNPAVLAQLSASSPGPRTTQALQALADASLFVDPPASEIPSTPAPDFAAQKIILSKTIHYVARTLPTLPDFMATRVTDHFDDTPQELKEGSWPVRAGFHLAGSFESPVSFLDGAERDTAIDTPAPVLKKVHAAKPKTAPKPAQAASGLNSWGEFRTILGIVLVDAAKGHISWVRWEKLDVNQAAVFQFQVDRSVSHYDVEFSRNRPSKTKLKTVSNYVLRQTVGYHGQLVVDPATGAVLKVIIDADLDPGNPIHRASMMVEYGPVKIGPHTYICPVRSISLSASNEVYQPASDSTFENLVELQLNESSFSGYRRFSSEATVLTANHATSDQSSDSAALPSSAASPPSPSSTSIADNVTAPPEQPAAEAAAEDAAVSASTGAISAEETKADEEILVRALDSLPGETTNADPADEAAADENSAANLTMKSTTRLVDVGLVAYDKHGKPITDLNPDQIEVYDNGRRQQLSAFHHAAPVASAAPGQPAQPALPPDTFTNDLVTTREVQDAPDLLILLIDESHLAFQDLNRARGELLRFLKATRPDSRIAIYAIGEHGFRAIQDVTQDHALASQKLTAWVPNIQSVARAQEDDTRLRQQFDTVRNLVDLNSVNGNYTEIPDGRFSTDPILRQMGQSPLRDVLGTMMILSRHFSAVPGHKSMAWISGDSALGYWEDRAVGLEKSTTFPDAGLQHTREALNDAHIALYIVDASAVEGGGVDPSLANQYVKLSQTAQDLAALGVQGPPQTQSRQDAPGRSMAQMQSDLHGIQGPVRQLAESTGGRAFNRGGDLKATLDSIVDDTDSHYTLAFRPDLPADGKYHSITVKVPSRKDVKLTYRNGYFYGEQSSTTSERFQQAIWSPQDAADVALTLHAVKTTDIGTIQLRIAFAGLALKQESPVQAGEGQSTTTANRWTDQLYIFVAQRDDATQKAQISGDTLRLSLKQSTYESGMPEGIPYQRTVDVKSGLGSVRILVVDGNSGKMGSVTVPASALSSVSTTDKRKERM